MLRTRRTALSPAELVSLVAALALVTAACTDVERGLSRETREAFVTDFSTHNVPLDELVSGRPDKDGIPSIDSPSYESVENASEWLAAAEPVIMIEIDGDARAFPVQILMWHEIANAEVGGRPVAVTYCPLCNTAAGFLREHDGVVLDFGTSGHLRFSNMVMYDRQTESWWQQATGEAIVGELTGTRLVHTPAPIVSWSDFARSSPDGKVLTRDADSGRRYGRNPYTGYDAPDREPHYFDAGLRDERLRSMDRVLGLEMDGEAVAYPFTLLSVERVVNDVVGGEGVVVLWAPGTASPVDAETVAGGRDVGAAGAYSAMSDGVRTTFEFRNGRIIDRESGSVWNAMGVAVSGEREGERLERLAARDHFWFSWAMFRPDTRVYERRGG
ncbi:MAG: DUF3179 domain-containing protein [Candidatus Eisenbacteria bacterium]